MSTTYAFTSKIRSPKSGGNLLPLLDCMTCHLYRPPLSETEDSATMCDDSYSDTQYLHRSQFDIRFSKKPTRSATPTSSYFTSDGLASFDICGNAITQFSIPSRYHGAVYSNRFAPLLQFKRATVIYFNLARVCGIGCN